MIDCVRHYSSTEHNFEYCLIVDKWHSNKYKYGHIYDVAKTKPKQLGNMWRVL